MKGLKLLLLAMLISVSAFSQTTPWTGTPAVTWQTRTYSGEKQIRALFGTSLISFMDSLHKFATKTQLQLAKDSLVNLYVAQTIAGMKTFTGDVTINAFLNANGGINSTGGTFHHSGFALFDGDGALSIDKPTEIINGNSLTFRSAAGVLHGLQNTASGLKIFTNTNGGGGFLLYDGVTLQDNNGKYFLKTGDVPSTGKLDSTYVAKMPSGFGALITGAGGNNYNISNFSTYASPPPNLQYLAIQPTTDNSPMRVGIIPKGIPPTATVHTFLSGFKIFRTDFQSDTLNNSDGGIYMTSADFRFNSKFNGTGLQFAPFKWSFQDTQIKMTLNQFGLGLGGDVTAVYPLDINYSTAQNDQGFNVLATETASNRTLYGGRITASNPSGTGSNIIGLQVTADKGATTGVMGSTGLDVINNIGARAAGGTATTYRGAQITLNGSTATSSTSTSVTNNALQVIMANTTAVGETGTDRGGIVTVTSMTGKTAKGLEVNVSGGTTNIAMDIIAGETRYNGSTANTFAYFDASKYLKTATQTGTGTTVVASVSPALTGTPTAPTAAAGTNTTQIATTAGIIAERTAAGTLNNKILAPANTYQASTGTTNDSLRFASSQRMVDKAIVAGNGINIVQTATSVTLSATGNPIVEITGTTQTAAANTIYIPHNAAVTTISIPTTTVIGSLYQVIGEGAGGWKFQFAAGQTAKGVGVTTTSGGSIASTDRYCTLTVRLVAANTFVITTSQGTLTPL